MPSNVIILTAGLAGSSVVTGLLARGGLWTGHETFRKRDYDTFENRRLIELNEALFAAAGFDGRYESEFPAWAVDAIEKRAADVDPEPFRSFIAECNRHAPWIWKDPRLTMTIRAWARWLDPGSLRFVLISREHLQSWISNLKRRTIESYAYHRAYNEQVRQSIVDFLETSRVSYFPLVYEDLIVKPEDTIGRLNEFCGTDIDMDDFRAVFSGRLYTRQHGATSLAKALAIYLKNFRDRRTLA